MCKQCSSIKALFETVGDNPHINYIPTILFLNGLESNNIIELYAGDCKLSEALNILNEEKHYTVCHYLKCKECGQIFFIGACIRGIPKYKQIEDIRDENINNLLWGKEGTIFSKKNLK